MVSGKALWRAEGSGRLRQWSAVVVQSLRDLWIGSALEWAAALAFYAVLSLFPLFIVGLTLASFVIDAAWASRHATDLLGFFLPGGQAEIESILTAASVSASSPPSSSWSPGAAFSGR